MIIFPVIVIPTSCCKIVHTSIYAVKNFRGWGTNLLKMASVPPSKEDKRHIELRMANAAEKLRGSPQVSRINIFGKQVEIAEDDTNLRIKRAQYIISFFGLLTMVTYLVNNSLYNDKNIPIFVSYCTCALITIVLGFGMLYYKNFSVTALKMLLREVNVCIILLCGLCLLLIEIIKPHTPFTPVTAFVFNCCLWVILSLDAIILKRRSFVLVAGSIFTIVVIYQIYKRTVGNHEVGVVLFNGIGNVPFYKRSIARSLYSQIFFFSLSGLWTMLTDKKMLFMMFGNGRIYKSSGTDKIAKAEQLPEIVQPCRSVDIINPLFQIATINPLFRGLNIKLQNTTNSSTTSSSPTELTFTRQGKMASSRERRPTIMILGEEKEILDKSSIQRRIKVGEWIIAVCFSVSALTFILNQTQSNGTDMFLLTLNIVFFAGALCSFFLLAYQNLSIDVCRRLTNEINVIMMLGGGLIICIIDFWKPKTQFVSPIESLLFFFALITILLCDAIDIKPRRQFLFLYFASFSIVVLYNVYALTFQSDEDGVILFYGLQNAPFYKRSLKRASYVHILLFSLMGLWTLIIDYNMEFILFATGSIYRSTGTSSLDKENDLTKWRSLKIDSSTSE